MTFKPQVTRIMKAKDIKISTLAKQLNMPYHQLYQKFRRNKFTEDDMKAIAKCLNMKLVIKLQEKK